MQNNKNELTGILRERMEDLLFEIVEMQDYLSEGIVNDEGGKLPLGVMGRVMSYEIQHEALNMLEKTEDILCKPTVDSWEKTRTSLYLNRKLSALGVFMRIIAQLPAHNQKAHLNAEAMAERIGECCKRVEGALYEITQQAVAQPA